MNDDERRLVPPVVVLGETGSNAAGALATAAPVMVVRIDATGASLEGDDAASAPWSLLSLARAHPSAVVIQSSVGAPGHLMRRVADAVRGGGPSLVHVVAPDPIACGIAPEKTASQARLAVEARVTPLFSASGESVDIGGNPAADREWATRTMTFKEPSGEEASIESDVTVADWAAGEARFQSHFAVVPKGRASDETAPLSKFVGMDAERREGLEAYIHLTGKGQRHVLAVVDDAMVRATEARREFWNALRAAAGPAPAGPAKPAQPTAAAAQPAAGAAAASAPALDASAHQVLTQELLRLCGFSSEPEFFKQSLRDFVVRRNLETGGAGEDGTGE